MRNPLISSLNDLSNYGADTDFIDMTSDERLNKKYLDLHKEMKINCVEDFSLSESQLIDGSGSKYEFDLYAMFLFFFESSQHLFMPKKNHKQTKPHSISTGHQRR